MNKRLKEILKEYEERKHKIIKGDERLKMKSRGYPLP